MDTQVYDVLIVGNGVLGLSTANALVRKDPSIRVALVGPQDRALGASPAAGAMMGCFGEITQASVSGKYGPIKLELGIQAHKLWPAWLERLNSELPAEAHVKPNPGTFVFCNSRSGKMEEDNYEVMRTKLREHNQRFEDVDWRNIPGMLPADDSRPISAMYLHDEGSLDASRLLAGLVHVAEKSSRVTFINEHVTELRVAGGRAQGVKTSTNKELSAKTVLLASGVESQRVLDSVPELARRVPRLFAGQGTSVVLEVDFPLCPSVMRTPNRSFACGLHLVPRGGNRVYVGATNNMMLKPINKPLVTDMFFLMDCIMEQVNQNYQAAQLVQWNVGNRPVSIDTLPLIGATSVEGLWMLSGTYRDGLHLSPLLSQHMAGLILGQGGLIDNHFPAERKPINRYTREQAIAETLKHYAAAGWEHSINIPKVGWHQTFQRMFERTVTSVYEELACDFVLPPEFVYVVDNDRKKMIPYFREYYQSVNAAW